MSKISGDVHIRDELLRHNSAFRAAVPCCKRSLANKLKAQHFLPRQYVIKQGDPVEKVIFILKGIVDVIGDGHEIVEIGKGEILSLLREYFGNLRYGSREA